MRGRDREDSEMSGPSAKVIYKCRWAYQKNERRFPITFEMYKIIHKNLINAETTHKATLSNGSTTENISSVLISQTQQLNAGPTGTVFILQ
jgi:hypothetical protein